MGTRLYPLTSDPARLERLARVDKGTAMQVALKEDFYKVFKEQHKDSDTLVDLYYDWHCLFRGSQVDRYETFNLFGWGKFDLDLVPSKQERSNGSTTDPKVMRRMLMSTRYFDLPYEPGDPSIDEIIKLSGGFYWT